MSNEIKKCKIGGFVRGERIVLKGFATITSKVSTKDNSEYFSLKVEDNTGIAYSIINANSNAFQQISKIPNDSFVEIECIVDGVEGMGGKSYNTFQTFSIKKIERDDLFGIVDIEFLAGKLREQICSIKKKEYKLLVFNFFKREDIKDKFFSVPSSQNAGYSFKGGLLASTVRLVSLVESTVSLVNNLSINKDNSNIQLDLDLLKTVAIISQIGKIDTFEIKDGNIIKTFKGKLLNDSCLSYSILVEEISKLNYLTEEEKSILLHTASSSKGIFKSSMTSPRTKEAYVFAVLSYLDRKIADFEYLNRCQGESGFVELFGKVLYLNEDINEGKEIKEEVSNM